MASPAAHAPPQNPPCGPLPLRAPLRASRLRLARLPCAGFRDLCATRHSTEIGSLGSPRRRTSWPQALQARFQLPASRLRLSPFPFQPVPAQKQIAASSHTMETEVAARLLLLFRSELGSIPFPERTRERNFSSYDPTVLASD